MLKFPINKNNKQPLVKWQDPNNVTCDAISSNYGVPCGKINNFTCIDLDFFYKLDEDQLADHPFLQFLPLVEPTKTNVTGRGGYHIYYEYEPDLKTGPVFDNHTNLHIDIKNDNSYVVGEGTVFNEFLNKDGTTSKLEYKPYDKPGYDKIIKMPADIKQWLLDLQKPKYKAPHLLPAVEARDVKQSIEWSNSLDSMSEINLKNAIRSIYDKLPTSFTDSYDDWLKLSTFLNKYDQYELFQEISEGYDMRKNDKIWNSLEQRKKMGRMVDTTNTILVTADVSEYYIYKSIDDQITKTPDWEINIDKLGKEPEILDKMDRNIIVNSDTGTGKTTLVKEYIKDRRCNVLSIVSRTSLADEQHLNFTDIGIDVEHYANSTRKDLEKCDSIIIQVDSLLKITNMDFTNKVVFLDEVNSIIEYLIKSTTLKDNRQYIYLLFLKIIRECKQVIGVDRDIISNTFTLFDALNIKYEYWINLYQHNRGVYATELSSIEQVADHLKREKEYLVASDSLNLCEVLENIVDDKDITMITSKTIDFVHLDSVDKAIFSPKIIYGQDSVKHRPMFAIFKCHTINPRQMVQQISRNRNITHLYYYFLPESKKVRGKSIKYSSYEEALGSIKNDEKYATERNIAHLVCNSDQNALYLELKARIEYNDSCYKSNMFAHFRLILNERGYILDSEHKVSQKVDKEYTTQLKDKKLDEFDIVKKCYANVNEYLKVPDDKVDDYKVFFVDDQLLRDHFRISKFFFEDITYLDKHIDNRVDFGCNIINSDSYKMKTLKQMLKAGNSDDKITVNNGVDPDQVVELTKQYNFVMKSKLKVNLEIKYELQKCVIKLYKKLFGKDVINSSRSGGKGREIKYSIDDESLLQHNNLYQFRTTGSKKNKNINIDENKPRDLFLDDEKEDNPDIEEYDDLLEVEKYDDALLIEAGMTNNVIDIDKLNEYYRLYDIKYEISN